MSLLRLVQLGHLASFPRSILWFAFSPILHCQLFSRLLLIFQPFCCRKLLSFTTTANWQFVVENRRYATHVRVQNMYLLLCTIVISLICYPYEEQPPPFNCSELISWPMTWTVVSFCHRFGSCSIWQFEGTWQGLLEAKRVNALLLPAGWLWLGVVQSRICWCQGARDTTNIFSVITTGTCMELAQLSTSWLFALKARAIAIISIALLGVSVSSLGHEGNG